jgi:hypothetical protein
MPVREVCRDGWSRKFHMWYTIDYCASSVCNPVGLILSEEEAATAGADPGVTATGHVASSRPLIHARGSMGGDIADVASNRPYRGGPRYNQLCGSLVLTPQGAKVSCVVLSTGYPGWSTGYPLQSAVGITPGKYRDHHFGPTSRRKRGRRCSRRRHCQLGEAVCGWDDRRVDLGGEGLG